MQRKQELLRQKEEQEIKLLDEQLTQEEERQKQAQARQEQQEPQKTLMKKELNRVHGYLSPASTRET